MKIICTIVLHTYFIDDCQRCPLQSSTVYARVGELIQGSFLDATPFLIPGPSSVMLRSRIFLSQTDSDDPLVLLREKHPRSLLACFLFFLTFDGFCYETLLTIPSDQWEKRVSYSLIKKYLNKHSLTIESNIPRGKGFSSSSADLLGVLSFLSSLTGHLPSDASLYRLAALIEPTDPCLDNRYGLFMQQKGEYVKFYDLPHYEFVYFDSDPKRVVDTCSVSKTAYDISLRKESVRILSNFEKGINDKNIFAMFDAVTESVLLNQKRIRTKGVEQWIKMIASLDAAPFIAHSGTMMGALFVQGRLKDHFEMLESQVQREWGTTLYHECIT